MISRPLQRAFRSQAPSPVAALCSTCACLCGLRFAPITSRRHYAGRNTTRSSPNVFKRNQRPRFLSPQEVRSNDAKNESYKAKTVEFLESLARDHGIELWPSDSCLKFMTEFESLADKARGQTVVHLEGFRALVREYTPQPEHLLWLARAWSYRDPFLGLKLLYTLSEAGYHVATVHILSNALSQNETKPGTIKRSEFVKPRQALGQYLKLHPKSCHARVLQGKIEQALGNEEQAIALWNSSVERAREKSRLLGRPKQTAHELGLAQPWVDLLMIHYQRSTERKLDEMDLCRRAIAIGCEEDDPTAFYYHANLNRRRDGKGDHVPTSEWLTAITKAACSGHLKAMHELGTFYAQSGWKYVEDEPPDDIKPTPFDSYPAASSTPYTQSYIDIFLQAIGLKSIPQPSAAASRFRFALYPTTAVQRNRLARLWFESAAAKDYLPSILFLANMDLEPTLWGEADAPPSALSLSPSRYPPDNAEHSEPSPRPDLPNPTYSLAAAKSRLLTVMQACTALELYARVVEDHEIHRRRGLTNKSRGDAEHATSRTLTPSMARWFNSNKKVRVLYLDELDKIWAEAAKLCDKYDWTLVDEYNSGLVYRAGSGMGFRQRRA